LLEGALRDGDLALRAQPRELGRLSLGLHRRRLLIQLGDACIDLEASALAPREQPVLLGHRRLQQPVLVDADVVFGGAGAVSQVVEHTAQALGAQDTLPPRLGKERGEAAVNVREVLRGHGLLGRTPRPPLLG